MLRSERGKVLTIDSVRGGAAEITVYVNDGIAKAMVYTELTGGVEPGDDVLLNTTAVGKKLGTGGYHYVMANLSKPAFDAEETVGHIVKCRYTPVQHTVLAAEEEDSPHRGIVENFESLKGCPVVAGQLHSQLAPAAAAAKLFGKKVCYVMTDTAALPIGFSKQVSALKENGFIDLTITCGQSFGGDLETVNVYTAMIMGASMADAVIVIPGPGNVGTGTKYGFSSIEQGNILNAAALLGGTPVALPRVSFADKRHRHQGVSHHSVTALSEIAKPGCVVPLPESLRGRLDLSKIEPLHRIEYMPDGVIAEAVTALAEAGIKLRSMGRGYGEDRELFDTAAAAGVFAGRYGS